MFNTLFDWIFHPLNEIKEIKECHDLITNKNKPIEIQHSSGKWRPETFEEYIGQEHAKKKIIALIEGVKKREITFPHTLIYGQSGLGKTTLANIIANYLGVPFKKIITSDVLDSNNLRYLIEQVNGGILFLDEIHGIKTDMAEIIYEMMEDFSYQGVKIKPFTLIGATTEQGKLLKKLKPFFYRFKRIKLEPYTIEELSKIARQYKRQKYPYDEFTIENYEVLAKNCRGIPRVVIDLLETMIITEQDIDITLKQEGILYEGFTIDDLKVLQYLHKNGKCGLQNLAVVLGESQDNYSHEIEPYLIQNNVIKRTPRGREITEEGIRMKKVLRKYNK